MIYQKLVCLESDDFYKLIAESDAKLFKNERNGWKLIDIRAYFNPEPQLSKIYLTFERCKWTHRYDI